MNYLRNSHFPQNPSIRLSPPAAMPQHSPVCPFCVAAQPFSTISDAVAAAAMRDFRFTHWRKIGGGESSGRAANNSQFHYRAELYALSRANNEWMLVISCSNSWYYAPGSTEFEFWTERFDLAQPIHRCRQEMSKSFHAEVLR